MKSLHNILGREYLVKGNGEAPTQHKLKVMMELNEAYDIPIKSEDLLETTITKKRRYANGKYYEQFYTTFKPKQSLIEKLEKNHPEALI